MICIHRDCQSENVARDLDGDGAYWCGRCGAKFWPTPPAKIWKPAPLRIETENQCSGCKEQLCEGDDSCVVAFPSWVQHWHTRCRVFVEADGRVFDWDDPKNLIETVGLRLVIVRLGPDPIIGGEPMSRIGRYR